MRTIYLAAALAGLAGAPALAQSSAPSSVSQAGTVADLAILCDPPADSPRRLEAIAYCQGYLTAAGQYHTALHPAGSSRPPLFCLPNPPPTVAQSGLAFAAWARQNPQYNSEPAVEGLLRWAQATYPCSSTTTQQRPARGGTAR
ncbi:Rap1a/Tai family immunity protein [Roseomonas sp. E05]|uniref:Rap1a/Tai family immunity protein n=1 Tax=Roseomonas sp. E05 TaxID=3046310 RepID=UPI0024B9A369|nr:Rap1a/Tai family immunity protein [Roseomonas sp. E05]MDJ0389935.1 Rap1a/Tai family immunity protein [Roseomonas sp. E05]